MGNLRANENFIVAKAAQTTIPVTGNIFANPLADGQIGIVSDSSLGTLAAHSFTTATPTITATPFIAIYQGNANSAAVAQATASYPLSVQPFERSASIDGRSRITVTKQAFRLPTHSTWIVGNPNASSAGKINVTDLTEYTLKCAFRGRRIDELYSSNVSATLNSSYTTPDFTSLGTTEAAARTQILHNIAYNINRNSTAFALNSRFPNNVPVVALLIDSAAGSGEEIGGSTPIAAGTVLTVVDVATGTDKTLTLTATQAASIINATLAKKTGNLVDLTWTIVDVDLVNLPTADMLLLIALDEVPAYVDRIPQIKVKLDVGLVNGFNFTTVANAEWEQADEGQGTSRVLDLLYTSTQGQRKYALRHTLDPVINYPSPIVSGESYVTYNITHSYETKNSFFGQDVISRRELILIPRYSTGTTAHPAIALLDTALNSYLADGNNPNVKVLD